MTFSFQIHLQVEDWIVFKILALPVFQETKAKTKEKTVSLFQNTSIKLGGKISIGSLDEKLE